MRPAATFSLAPSEQKGEERGEVAERKATETEGSLVQQYAPDSGELTACCTPHFVWGEGLR